MKKIDSLKALATHLRAMLRSIQLDDIQPLTAFLRDTKAHTGRLQKSGRPVVLTVNGKASLVVQSARAYQVTANALDLADQEIGMEAAMGESDAGIPIEELAAKWNAEPKRAREWYAKRRATEFRRAFAKDASCLKDLSDQLRTMFYAIKLEDIQPMTAFLRDAKGHAKRLQESCRPALLTVNGKASLVVQSAQAYQAMGKALDLAADELAIARDAATGRPMREGMEESRVKPGIPKAA